MLRHLKSCLAKRLPPPGAKAQPILHLRIEGSDAPQYWLHVELRHTESFAELDHFLREIWLECCGHLSSFAVLGRFPVSVKPGKVFYEWMVDHGFVDNPLDLWDLDMAAESAPAWDPLDLMFSSSPRRGKPTQPAQHPFAAMPQLTDLV